MITPICMSGEWKRRNLPNICSCPQCARQREHEAAIEWYRENYGRDAAHFNPFPEREK